MSAKTKKWYSLSLLVCSLLFTISALPSHAEIPSYYRQHYQHAKQILQQQDPDFLTAFETFSQEINGIESYNQRAQYEALMRFFPHIEQMLKVSEQSFSYTEEGTIWNLETEVVVTFFLLDIETADQKVTHVGKILFDAFKVSLAGGDASGILSEQALMKKHQITSQQAKHIRRVLHQLYPTSTLL